MTKVVVTRRGEVVQDPPFIKKLLNSPLAGWLWLLPRLWLGYQWIDAGSHKISSADWMVTGNALKGYWTNAIAIPAAPAKAAITFDWYRSFLQGLLNAQTYTWFAKLVAIGEVAVGIALILGAFTGIAAIFGGLMNWNYMMAGSASTNPLLFLVAVGLIVAWKVSGYIGADYFLLRWIGTPWRNPKVETEPVEGKQKIKVTQPAEA